MDTGRDILIRTSLLAAAAVISFAAAIFYLRRRRLLNRNALFLVLALYWGLLAADAFPLVAAWVFALQPGACMGVTLAAYAAACIGAFFAVRKGFRAAVAAVAAAVILRWILYGFFVWTYGFEIG